MSFDMMKYEYYGQFATPVGLWVCRVKVPVDKYTKVPQVYVPYPFAVEMHVPIYWNILFLLFTADLDIDKSG